MALPNRKANDYSYSNVEWSMIGTTKNEANRHFQKLMVVVVVEKKAHHVHARMHATCFPPFHRVFPLHPTFRRPVGRNDRSLRPGIGRVLQATPLA